MRFFQKTIFAVCVLLAAGAGRTAAQSSDFKTVQHLDIFHSLLRELSMFYVDSVKTDQLLSTAIDAMLESLDPYTVYLPEEVSDDFDFVTTGQYGGIGALIKKVPGGIEISEPYRGFPADRAGLVAGDLLVAIDGMPTENMVIDKASRTLKGPAGTSVAIKVVTLRGGDTLSLSLTRERVHISDVLYAGLLPGGVGYIRVASFTKDGSRDFKNAFVALQKTGELKHLILDVRSNGGGLLDEAVNMVGLFVPRGTEVVTARGRIRSFEAIYKTKDDPLDLHLPIAVLVNSASASAAEILAGSLQDLDRAVVVGTRTFGKGLVQSVRNLGYNTQLKITTAKYYIPSGRCVQILDYSHRNDDGSVGQLPDSLIRAFRTKNGRTVYDGGGITPDVVLAPPAYAKITYDIVARDILRDYSVVYFASHPEIALPEAFRLSDEEYAGFVDFAAAKEFDDRTMSELLLGRLQESLQDEQLYEANQAALNALRQSIQSDKRQKLLHYRPELQRLLEEEICARYYYADGRLRALLPRDPQVKAATEILLDRDAYGAITGTKERH
jgi:carboxyl-terminal processing protease